MAIIVRKQTTTHLHSCASLIFAAALLSVSGCTVASGPDIGVATYGITSPQVQSSLVANNSTTPDQAPGVIVASGNSPLNQISTIGQTQSFAPGAAPPSVVLQELASSTALNSTVATAVTSGSYVTEGVTRDVGSTPVAPLTPVDVAGQVPVPAPLAQPPVTQVASLAVDANRSEVSLPIIPDPVVAPKSARPVAKTQPGLFSSLFGNRPKKAEQVLTALPVAEAAPAENDGKIELASLETSNESGSGSVQSMESLPGVNSKNLFALDPLAKNGGEDSYEEEPPVQLASATAPGLARLAPNGILKQTDKVEVACFKPELISVLKRIESHYGRKIVVTSGYRSPTGNRRAGGSRQSLHITCAAADIQVSGVGKWELAKYLRSMPGRGGVGTYCYTDSVHIDVGSERDWNWRCRRR